MTQRLTIVLLLFGVSAAQAQPPLGGGALLQIAPPDPAVLFRNQCGTCHVTQAGGPPRQGPILAGIYLRQAGAVAGFKYSPAFTTANFAWDDAHLDAWLTNPQAVLPGAVMVYRQANPATRLAIIGWLKEQR